MQQGPPSSLLGSAMMPGGTGSRNGGGNASRAEGDMGSRRVTPSPAHGAQMLVKQKEANRQSLILMRSADPSAQLLKALEEVAALTQMVEEAKQEHLEKVRSHLTHSLHAGQRDHGPDFAGWGGGDPGRFCLWG